MSGFIVSVDSVNAAADNVNAGTNEVVNLQSPIAGLTGAADGTPAAADFEDYLTQWTVMLPQIADSNDSIATALTTAAASYSQADSTVAGPTGGTAQ